MKNDDEGFVRAYKQSKLAGSMEIWIDKVTGVNYLYRSQGYSGGLTALLDRSGKPFITPVTDFDK